MLVYGDHKEIADSRESVRAIAVQLDDVGSAPPGLDRHARLVAAFVQAGQLLQGAADAGLSEANDLNVFLLALARCLVRSWDSGFADRGELPSVPDIDCAVPLELRFPEGFAFYAVYPESYIEAARRLRLTAPARVIGIRSIGTTLGAAVAAALDAPPPVTVRPFGDAFARTVELGEDLLDQSAHYVIVDEGPGLSGSSFGAVADWLEDRGVPPERIGFIPSHGGDLGPEASERHRQRWRKAQRVAASFEPTFLAKPFGPIESYMIGDPWERLKFLGQSPEGMVLLKFAGIGAIGERKLAMARELSAVGFTPEPLGLVHGFLVERWRGDALHLAPEDKPVREIGEYIGIRGQLFPAAEGSGATIDELATMCRRNLSLVFGDELAGKVDRWKADALSRAVRRVRTDNKLDREEWLRLPDGHLLKTDALDHHCAHDLIGCQDLAWDVAGAIVELALHDAEAAELVEVAERASKRRVDATLLDFYRVAYCCFRLGQANLASQWVADKAERQRLRTRAVRYEVAVLSLLIDNYSCFTPQDSLVD